MDGESPASSGDRSPRQDATTEQAFAPTKHKRVLVRSSRPGTSTSKRSSAAVPPSPAGMPPGQLHLVSPYAGAAVWINGQPAGTVPMIWESGVPGEEFLVEYRMPGFDSVAFRVVFPHPGEMVECSRSLDPKDEVLETRLRAKFSSEQVIREALHRLFLQAAISVEQQIELLDQVARDPRGSPYLPARLLRLYEALVAELAGEDVDPDLPEEEAWLARMASAGCGSFQVHRTDSHIKSEGMQTTLLFDESEAEPSSGPARGSLPVETQTSVQLFSTADAATSGGDLRRYLHLELVCEELPAEKKKKKGHHHHHPHRRTPAQAPAQSPAPAPVAKRSPRQDGPRDVGPLGPGPAQLEVAVGGTATRDGAASPSLPLLVRPTPRDSVALAPTALFPPSPPYLPLAASPSLARAAPAAFPTDTPAAPAAASPDFATRWAAAAGFALWDPLPDATATAALPRPAAYATPQPALLPASPPLYRTDAFRPAAPSDAAFFLLASASPRFSGAAYLSPSLPAPAPFPTPAPPLRSSLGLTPEYPLYPTLTFSLAPAPRSSQESTLSYFTPASSSPYPAPTSASAPSAPLYPVLDMASLGLAAPGAFPQLLAMQPRVVNFVPQQAVLDVPPIQRYAWWSPFSFGTFSMYPEAPPPYFYPLL